MRKLVTIVAPLVMIATGCAAEGDGTSDLDESRRRQVVSMFDLVQGTQIGNSTVQLRRDIVTTFDIRTVVNPDEVYTAWICGWNDPSECQFGGGEAEGNNLCGEADIDISQTFFCQHAGGAVATATGELFVVGHDYDGAEVSFGDGEGMTNPFGAEIQIVLRSHGPVLADQLAKQLSEYEGGCEVNTCDATQYSIFPPIQ